MTLYKTHVIHSQSKCGFTLLEIAVISSIVGTIFGAIWVACGIASESIKVNQFGRDINYLLTKVGGAPISTSNWPANAACHTQACTGSNGQPTQCYSGWSTASGDAIIAGLGYAPTDMLTSPGSKALQNPWGYNQWTNHVEITLETWGVCTAGQTNGGPPANGAPKNTFGFDSGQIPSDACVKLLLQNKAAWIQRGLVQFCTNNCQYEGYYTTVASATAGLTNAVITHACSLANPIDFSIVFSWPLAN